jgi:hypothetical protein
MWCGIAALIVIDLWKTCPLDTSAALNWAHWLVGEPVPQDMRLPATLVAMVTVGLILTFKPLTWRQFVPMWCAIAAITFVKLWSRSSFGQGHLSLDVPHLGAITLLVAGGLVVTFKDKKQGMGVNRKQLIAMWYGIAAFALLQALYARLFSWNADRWMNMTVHANFRLTDWTMLLFLATVGLFFTCKPLNWKQLICMWCGIAAIELLPLIWGHRFFMSFSIGFAGDIPHVAILSSLVMLGLIVTFREPANAQRMNKPLDESSVTD